MRAVAVALLALLTRTAYASDDDVAARSIVFARGDKLIKSDGRGRNETTVATLADARPVRALRSDPKGTVLLADIGGAWSWMPLDGSSKTLTALPCDAGPAQLSNDGTYVLCRRGTGSLVVNLRTGKLTPIEVPTPGARLTGTGAELRLAWSDGTSVWSAVPPQRKAPTKVVPQAPLRHLLVSPDGTRGVGVYKANLFETPRTTKPGEALHVFALDGSGARRKVIQNGVPLEWSHDSKWLLVQDGASACVMAAVGGQYKCWKGYTAAAISGDGKYALVFGSPEMAADKKPEKKPAKKSKKSGKKDRRAKQWRTDPEAEGDVSAEAEQPGDAPTDEAGDDVALAPPGGPVALYRAELDGAFTKRPTLVARDAAGAAVWLPAPPF